MFCLKALLSKWILHRYIRLTQKFPSSYASFSASLVQKRIFSTQNLFVSEFNLAIVFFLAQKSKQIAPPFICVCEYVYVCVCICVSSYVAKQSHSGGQPSAFFLGIFLQFRFPVLFPGFLDDGRCIHLYRVAWDRHASKYWLTLSKDNSIKKKKKPIKKNSV